ncbi:MAG: hypothetical protein M0Q29_09515 [Thiopseudomonas sp.]|nr:hypothetical protein [Thiopseudomonas sp.]
MVNSHKKIIYTLAAVSLAVSVYLLHVSFNAYQELEEDRALCGKVTIVDNLDNSETYQDNFSREFYAIIYPVDDGSIRDKNGEIVTTDSEGSFAAPYLPPPVAFSERDLRLMTRHIPGCGGAQATEVPEPGFLSVFLLGLVALMIKK